MRSQSLIWPFLGLLDGQDTRLANVVLAIPDGTKEWPGLRWKLAWIADAGVPTFEFFGFNEGRLTRLADFAVTIGNIVGTRTIFAQGPVMRAFGCAKRADGTPWHWVKDVTPALECVTCREDMWPAIERAIQRHAAALKQKRAA